MVRHSKKAHGPAGGMLAALVLLVCSCASEFDPDKAIRIVYENPQGCDEIAGTITLKASVQGEGAPVPAAMRYELRTHADGEPITVTGEAPSYEAAFDTTALRDGFVYLTALPLDEDGRVLDLKAYPYSAPGFIPPYRGCMVNNGSIDIAKPLILMGSAIEPWVGELSGTWTAEQLQSHLIFAASLMTHLEHLGFLPEFCFNDLRTIVMDPADPQAGFITPGTELVDVRGQAGAGTPLWNPGTLCLQAPFLEVPAANGILDIWEHTALDNVRFYDDHGPVNAAPDVTTMFHEIGDRLLWPSHVMIDDYSMFAMLEPVPFAEPVSPLKEKLKNAISGGATSVWMFDFYYKANDFEMSAGAWPQLQEVLDEVNAELKTSVRLGALTTNAHQLMNYESLMRSFFLSVRELVRSTAVPAGSRVGIVLAAHGSSKTNRLYDVSRINNRVLYEGTEAFFTSHMAGIFAADTPLYICYSEYANEPDDGLRGVGEQVAAWVDDSFDYVFVFPLEWTWASRDIWEELRANAVALLDAEADGIYQRDERSRSEVVVKNTHLVIGETIVDQREYNPAAYHYLKAAAAHLLEDRLGALSGAAAPQHLSGTVALSGDGVQLAVAFEDTLLAQSGHIMLQRSGISAQGATEPDRITGTCNTDETAYLLFAVLAENGIDVDSVSVSEAQLDLTGQGGALHGAISGAAALRSQGKTTDITFKVTL